MRFIGYFICIVSSQASAIRAVYSRFSGLVVSSGIQLGSRREAFPMSIDFSLDHNIIFSPTVCPVSVTCFSFENSRTFSTSCAEVQVPYLNGLMTGIKASDDIQIGDGRSIPMSTPFTFVTRWVPTNTAFREVGGLIGASLLSDSFSHRIIAVSDVFPDMNGVMIQELNAKGRTGIEFHTPSVRLDQWMFEAGIGSLSLQFRFNPSEEDLVISETLKEAFFQQFDHLITVRGNEVLGKCSQEGTLDPEIGFSIRVGGSDIRVNSHQIATKGAVAAVHDVLGHACQVRIRIVPSEWMYITIGRQLIRSVEYIVLDYPLKRIGFRRLSKSHANPPLVERPSARVPIYELIPRVIAPFGDASTGDFRVDFHEIEESVGIPGLILSAEEYRWFEDDRRIKLFCFVLLKTHPGIEHQLQHLPGTFGGVSLRREPGLVSIALARESNEGSALKASIRESFDSIRVCLQNASESGSKDVKQCKLCSRQVAEDTSLDGTMRGCSAREFHPECLERLVNPLKEKSSEMKAGPGTHADPCCVS